MTLTERQGDKETRRQGDGRAGGPGGGGRLGIVAVMIVALAGTMGTRYLADGMHSVHTTTSTRSLSSMNSFTLGLLLGGLRGPLVMVLWSSSEESKNAKDLEDFDTKLEFIRMLQPEFRRVHIYQMWNKAYNISVQRASKANKYADILDAIEYGEKVRDQLGEDINIIAELGRLWADKLGGDAQQKAYYYRRVCDETRWPANQPADQNRKVQRVDDNTIRRSGAKPLELAPRLDERGNILPKFRDQVTADGKTIPGELHYLMPFEPFPDGISPQAMGYNYEKWAQELQSNQHQKHLDMGPSIVSSRPAMGLKIWGQDELDRGRRLELLALTLDQARPDVERSPLQMMTAGAPLTAPIKDQAAFDEALRRYTRVQQVHREALKEYQRHITSEFGGDEWTYRSHIDDVNGEIWLAAADEAYLKAMVTTDAEKKKALVAAAAANYQKALDQFRRIVLRYYTEDTIASTLYQKHAPDPRSKLPVLSQMDSASLESTYREVMNQVAAQKYDTNFDTRSEYDGFLGRCVVRLQKLK